MTTPVKEVDAIKIGQADPDEPADALLLAYAGARMGDAEREAEEEEEDAPSDDH